MDEGDDVVEEWVLALAGSPWVYLALYLFATIDGFFPPIPSESVVIALAALSMSTGEPSLWLVGAVAAAGAFTGDQIAYSIGQRLPVRRLRIFRGERAQRGAAYIIAARYIPVGRVAVNMTAGTVRYSRRRFTLLAAIAALSWATYSVLLGVGAGIWLKEHPLVAVLVGVAGGVVIGLVIDALLRRVLGSRRGRPEGVSPAATSSTQAGALAPSTGSPSLPPPVVQAVPATD